MAVALGQLQESCSRLKERAPVHDTSQSVYPSQPRLALKRLRAPCAQVGNDDEDSKSREAVPNGEQPVCKRIARRQGHRQPDAYGRGRDRYSPNLSPHTKRRRRRE